ncbi:sugar-binding protein [Aquibacillus sp. 3ASR75-11]|uniref:Sugar-binding protein n=1 Tax=Terrihalobacillus insolitus TaxID=2950438 RepID=A0A9X3WTP2_9BACI|nr:sugar-binding protein [Terrihalobacillus insolitus]MDC3412083.1 sugar-binding protein [Terrihalobacillus insolitus]MDC3423224.1 sugar-binding protein [Terrihalobacillus insolitus]
MFIRKYMTAILVALLLLSLFFSIYYIVKAMQIDTKPKQLTSFTKPQYHFVLIPEEMDNPYWQMIEQGAKEAATKYDAAVEYTGPEQTDMDQHIKVMEMAIASKADGILTQGLTEEMIPVINEAIQQGIPVVTLDTDATDSRRLAYVGTDNYAAGFLAGQTLAKATNGSAKVGIITGSLQSTSQQERVNGFRDAVKQNTEIEIVAVEPSNISRVQAADKTYQIFTKYPDVTAFFGTSALDGPGISATVQSLGRTKDVYILAFDTLPETLKLIKQGTIDATVAQQPYEMGYKGLELMVDIANGENVQEINYLEAQIVRSSDLPLENSLKGEERVKR